MADGRSGAVQMAAVVWHGRGDVRVETRELPPAPPPSWVRLEVAWCGICGSDTTELVRGPVVIPVEPHPLTGTMAPLVLGHEFTGRAAATGGAEPFPPGTRLVSDVLHGCGGCAACARGDVNLCHDLAVAGLSMDGGLATHVDVPARSCVVVPDGLPLEVAALAEPLAVAERAVDKAALRDEEQVVILGAGAIGVLIAVLLSGTHGGRVDCIERHAPRREFVQRVSGVPAVETFDRIDLAGGRSLVLFECTGNADALNEAIDRLPASARIVLIGVHGSRTPVDLNALLHKEIALVASLSHSRADFARAVERLGQDPARFESVISNRVSLSEAPAAVAALASSTVPPGKTLVKGSPWTN